LIGERGRVGHRSGELVVATLQLGKGRPQMVDVDLDTGTACGDRTGVLEVGRLRCSVMFAQMVLIHRIVIALRPRVVLR
jgi:hypothetical protein